MPEKIKVSYQDIQRVNLFFNDNNGTEIIRRLIEQCQSNVDNADTIKAKWQWIELRSRLNQVAEQAADILEFNNKELSRLK